jgi:hypothetical protein
MHDRHWTDDELISNLFGVGPDNRHLEACADCARRWDFIKRKHDATRETRAIIPEAKLAAQRMAIRSRLEGKRRNLRLILTPSLATALLIALAALVLFRRDTPVQRLQDAVVEDTVMEEIYQTTFSSEPTAIEPVQALFEGLQ